MARFGTWLVVFLALGCGDDTRGPTDTGTADSGPDATLADAGTDAPDIGTDGGMDAGPDSGAEGCMERLLVDTDFALAEDARTNIHPAAAFDGEKLWLTYTVVEEGTSIFDVMLRFIRCDGTLGPELRVNTVDGESELDSTVAISGDRVLVGFQGDDQSGEGGALRPFVRIYDLTGTPQGDPIEIATQREGMALGATNWMVQVAPRPDGFWAAGTWGVEAFSAFQAWIQPLDMNGTPSAEATDFATTASDTQTNPVLFGGATPTMAWSVLGDANSTVHARVQGNPVIDIDAMTVTANNPALAGALIAYDAGGGSRLDIHVQNLETGARDSIGGLNVQDAAPAIAGTPDAFAVTWLEQTSGVRNELRLAFGSETDGTMTLGSAIEVPTSEDVYAYPPTITEVAAGTYFLTWSQGAASPNFQIHGRIVQAE